MALSLPAIGVLMLGGDSSLRTSARESALGRVFPLRGRSTALNGLWSASFSRTRKLKNDFSAEIRLALVRLETFC